MDQEIDGVTDSMRVIATRLYDQVLQAPGARGPLKLLAAWLRQHFNHRLALIELQSLLKAVSEDPVDTLHRMAAFYGPPATRH